MVIYTTALVVLPSLETLPYPAGLLRNGTVSRLPPPVGGVLLLLSDPLLTRFAFGLIISRNNTDGINSRMPYSHHHRTRWGGATTLRAKPSVLEANTKMHKIVQVPNRMAKPECADRLGRNKVNSRGQKYIVVPKSAAYMQHSNAYSSTAAI
eukprot:scaffold12194_cov129-Cylindrotheca_fusiformis.AAC.19